MSIMQEISVNNLINCILYGQTSKFHKYIENCNCEQLLVNYKLFKLQNVSLFLSWLITSFDS